MRRIHVVKARRGWVAKSGGRIVSRGRTKVQAVRRTARVAKSRHTAVSVMIHKMNGRFQEERTYPRRADPRRSRG